MQYSLTTPYLVRAIHEWCVDNGLTPHILVVAGNSTVLPMEYVKNGEIVLNLSYNATKNLQIENEAISFSARFGGVSKDLYIPITSVKGIFARENGQGMFFEVINNEPKKNENPFQIVENEEKKEESSMLSAKKAKKPSLKIVK